MDGHAHKSTFLASQKKYAVIWMAPATIGEILPVLSTGKLGLNLLELVVGLPRSLQPATWMTVGLRQALWLA